MSVMRRPYACPVATGDVEQQADRTFFFQHIMKTAGTSFVQHLVVNFDEEETYPFRSGTWEEQREQYWLIAPLRDVPAERRERVRLFHGHLPFLVGDLVGADVRMTIVRDPVERVISHIAHCRRQHIVHQDRPLEAVYEDGWLHPHFFRNYQVKQFALTIEDDPKAHNEVITIDDARLQIAVANLQRVDVLGLTDRYDEFLADVVARFGWSLGRGQRLQVRPDPVSVSAAFRAQIEADNQADLEFYEAARELHRRRRAEASGTF
jgi:hypothetical protein